MLNNQPLKKNKIILVNPGLSLQKTVSNGVYPNTAIMILSTILKSNGFEIIIIDGNYLTPEDAIKSIYKQIDNNLVMAGFSVMTIQLPWAYKVTSEIKKNFPFVKIAWGGVHPTLFPEQTIEDGNIDIAVINDAASTITKLCNYLSSGEDLSNIEGICYRKGKDIYRTAPNSHLDDFTNVPEIDFGIIDHRLYSRNNCVANEEYFQGKYASNIVYPVITGLGCCYKCTFCINVILQRKYKFRNALDIINRIKFLKKEYNADFIQPMDENFFVNKKRVFEFVDLLEEEKLNIKWRPQLRADYFNDNYINLDFARRLERSGMVIAAMGVESASQRVLNMLRKQLKVEDTIRAIKILSKTNIVPKVNFMVGLPGETEKEIRATYNLACLIRKMEKRSYVSITPFRLYPGSLLYENAVSEYGYQAPQSLKEWVSNETEELNFKNLGYGSYNNHRWIKNLKKFQAMQSYYQYITFYNKRWENFILYRLFIKLIFLRFKTGFFGLFFLEQKLIECAKKTRKAMAKILSWFSNK